MVNDMIFLLPLLSNMDIHNETYNFRISELRSSISTHILIYQNFLKFSKKSD